MRSLRQDRQWQFARRISAKRQHLSGARRRCLWNDLVVGTLYPSIEPFATHFLEVGQGHSVFVEVSGNPTGKPALALHGGPGSGSSPGMRRFFNPQVYRIVLFDQRGCGRSTPSASDPDIDLSTNTTGHLLGDIEAIRQWLGIDRWLIYGHSWGSLLGLAYAVWHPERVTEAVLSGVAIGDPAEIRWLYKDLASIRPEEFDRFRAGVPEAEDDDLIDAYANALFDPDPTVRTRAASAFTNWDWSSASAKTSMPMTGRWIDPAFQLARSRIVTHYFRNNCWLDAESLLNDAGRLGKIPAVLVNGALDIQTPIHGAERLEQSWPGSELVIVKSAGHATGDEGVADAIVEATDRFGALP